MLEWRADTLPVSTRFDDPYYSKEDGRAETSHVFINGNSLPDRWPDMTTCAIAELGFGTGLNFLETARQWRNLRKPDAKLHFISFEQYPMAKEDIDRALSAWPKLAELKKQLLNIWETHQKTLDQPFTDDIRLTVHFDDANDQLPIQGFKADAWYLDGFSPAKNPELWNERLMTEVSHHTVACGTFATYTAAGFVKRNLQSAGFQVSKTKGFGRKRDMLIGQMTSDIHVA